MDAEVATSTFHLSHKRRAPCSGPFPHSSLLLIFRSIDAEPSAAGSRNPTATTTATAQNGSGPKGEPPQEQQRGGSSSNGSREPSAVVSVCSCVSAVFFRSYILVAVGAAVGNGHDQRHMVSTVVKRRRKRMSYNILHTSVLEASVGGSVDGGVEPSLAPPVGQAYVSPWGDFQTGLPLVCWRAPFSLPLPWGSRPRAGKPV